MALLGARNSKGGLKRIQTGVYHRPDIRCDLLFVTLEKSEKQYTPTTLYRDHPISDDRFHWETQNVCHAGTTSGRRYLATSQRSDDHALLFVRQSQKDSRGETMPYTLLGRCFHAAHRGERPIQIEWQLEHPMPASLFQAWKLAGG